MPTLHNTADLQASTSLTAESTDVRHAVHPQLVTGNSRLGTTSGAYAAASGALVPGHSAMFVISQV